MQFANGVNAIIAYNPNTTQEPFNNQFSATSNSMAILYDVTGNKNPNKYGEKSDIYAINVTELAGTTGCAINPDLVGGMCISQILAPGTGYSALTYAECTEAKNNGEIDVDACYNGNDYFAGAVKACGGKKANLPSQDQLTQLAKYVYGTDSINSSDYTNDLALDTTKASQFLSGSSSVCFLVWSGQEDSGYGAYGRYFYSTHTYWINTSRDISYKLAVCLDH